MEQDFGSIKKINVRKYFPSESSDFTPWLAKAENISQLSNAIGIELEVENTEVSVGPYSADILAKDIGTGKYIVIENQLEKTDHDHLGKAITYASVLDASAIIWIAKEFTEEHKKALDWLNDHTSDEVSFFGVKLELWQIDTSKPALVFNVISNPINIVRQTALKKASGEISEIKKLQFEFWTEFRNRLLKTKELPSVQTPRPQHWFDISLGRSNIHISTTVNSFDNKISVLIYISNKIADIALSELLKEKTAIEKEIGCELNWNPFPEKMDKIISLSRDADIWKREKWDEYLKWLLDYVLRFRMSFSKRVMKLDFTKKSEQETTE
jgi:phosphoglycerate-specific signal transduction histidine kinase